MDEKRLQLAAFSTASSFVSGNLLISVLKRATQMA
jgi:hypothetical protein